MFNKKSSRHSLALFVALTLGSGTLLTAAPGAAADVTGNNVTIDDTHAPSDNAIHPGGGAAFGTAAGFIKEENNSGNVTGNTLTFKNVGYTKQLYGGLTFGTGNVTGNQVIVNPATTPLLSSADGIFGGAANGGGNVEHNHAEFNGDHLNGDLVGGMAKGAGTGFVKNNTAILKGGNLNGKNIYGGLAADGANGDVLNNTATIDDGHAGEVYGGYADGNGNVKGNTVTVKGGTMTSVEGGHSDGTGEVSGNTVNLGDGTSTMAAGYAINGTIYGGRNDSHPDKVSNNTLNVNTNATAHNIKNFSTINFNFSTHTDTNHALLELTDTNKTKLDSLSQLYVKNAKVGRGILMWNSNGFEITDSTKVGRTEEKTETIIEKAAHLKAINYRTYQFKDSRTTDFEGTNTWGGHSTIGNTTTGNEVTVSGIQPLHHAYGGWTKGSGSTATGENAQNHSIGNKITLEGGTSNFSHMTGGATDSPNGNATKNHAILEDGTLSGSLKGGYARYGNAIKNIVEIKNGRVNSTISGGHADSAGKAEGNEVTLTNGSANGEIRGGISGHGDTVDNTVTIKGGSATTADVYGGKTENNGNSTGNKVFIEGGGKQDIFGGYSRSGNATGNTVTITGGTVRNVDGGRSLTGNATNNTVNLGDGKSNFAGSITGVIYGGGGSGSGDYLTGNTLNVYDNVTVSNISNFENINFRFNTYVTKTDTFLTLTNSGGTFIKSLSGLNVHGEHGRKGTLLKNTHGTITISEGGDRLVKTNENKELVLAKSSDSKQIDYEGYAFAHQTAPTTVTEGGTTNTWGGRSIGGNSTRKNVITVTSGTHTNIYGGWTAGSGTTADDKDNSYKNEVTLDSGATTDKLYGGYTDNAAGKAEKNIVTVNGGTISTDLYGGIANKTTGTGHVKENIVNISGGTVNNVYGGFSAGSGEVSGNKVTATGGTGLNDVRGGYATSGAAKGNKVTLGAVSTGAVTGGRGATAADDNEVTLTGTTVTSVTGGEGATTKKNIVNLNGGVTINGALKGGTGTPGAAGEENKLNVKGTNSAQSISDFQKLHFDTEGASATNPLLNVTGGAMGLDWNALDASGTATNRVTLLKNAAGITLSNHTPGKVKSKINSAGTTEYNIDVLKDNLNNITDITYEGYQFKDVRQATTVTDAGITNTFGGRSKAGNSTRENEISVESGTHTNVYGGWTSGSGTTAADKDMSYENKVKVSGSANVTNTVYGGFTEAADGKATGNEVTIEKAVHDVVGGQAAGEASGNTVTVSANAGVVTGGKSMGDASSNIVNLANAMVNSVTGGEGTITNNNIVNLNGGANVTGYVKGGTQANGAGNTLNVKGVNSAGTISGFQKLHFDTEGASTTNPLLNITGGATNLDWNTLDASGTSVNRVSLLKNAAGINLTNHTPGTVKSKINEAGTTEYNIDVAKTGALTTDITYQGYQFKGKTTATTEGTDTYGGRSKAGNTTTANDLTVDSGSHTNIYGGWTSGAGSTADAAKQKDSIGNKATVKGTATATGDVIGGLTDVAGGKATGNTVTVEKDLAANIIGGKAAAEASNNTVNLSNATVNSVTGGEGTITNNNIVNLNGGANVTGDVKGGTQANGAGNTLNVKGVNSAGTISGFQKLHFDTEGASTTNPLLNITGGATNLDWNTLDASGTSVNRVSLLKNAAGINLSNHTPGTVKSKINDAGTTEYNIDVEKTSGTITDITYQGYQFKGKTTATTEGTDTYGGRSKAGNTTTENDLTVDSGSHTNIYGGWTSGAGSSAAPDKQKDSIGNKVTVKGTAAATGDVIGGLTDVADGKATGNTVTVEKDLAANIIGGKAASGDASGNTVNLANATVNSITGGDGTTTNNNTVNLNGSAQVTGALKGGSAGGTDNTLNVKGKNNKAGSIENIQKMNFDATDLAKDDTMLEDTNAAGTNVDWANLNATGTAAKPLTLLKNANGINLAGYTGAVKSETGDTTETNIDVRKTGALITEITYEGYQFKDVRQATTVTDAGVTNTFGGRSKAGNSTRDNEITVESGTHTNVYGGWTSGSGTTAEDKNNSYKNKVTVNGSANVTNTVYGGFTEAADGKATGNEVTVTGGTVHDVVGGQAAGEASGNTVTVSANAGIVTGGRSTGEASTNIVNLANATVNSLTGGEGAMTNNNIVNLKGNAQVTGTLTGGSAANGTGNTLNVTGTNNKAGSIAGFQKLTFDAANADANPMLQVTGGATTDADWTNLTATGAASETPKTLMENTSGINTIGRTGDAAKSELNTDATMETNIDVVKSSDKVTALTYEGYTFKGSTKTTTYGADTWAGRSKAGNTTQDNTLTLDDASKTYANVYGGWTSGTGTKAAADKQNNSLNNTVNYTAGTVTGALYGGHAAAGEASGNTVNLGAIQTAANIYGGFGTVTKNNTINLKGARVTGTVYGGSAANGTGNTLAVYRPSEVQDFAGVQNLHFHTDELTAGNTTPLLKLGTTTKDIRGLNIGVDRRGDAPKLKKGDKLLLMKTAGGDLTTDDKIENKIEGKQGMARRYTYEIKKENTGELTATVTHAGLGDDAKSPVETRAGLSNLVNQGADYIVESGISAAETALRTDAGAGSSAKSDKSAQRKTAATDNASYQLWAGAGANTMRVESGSHVDSKGWSLGVGWAREDEMKDGAKRLFSPFVEYGRGSYDSYLDNGAHGSGTIRYLGIGVLGKLTQKDGLWLEGSVRGGRATSDYQLHGSSDANYDGSNTYYGIHLGIGKTVELKKDATIDAYARYFWSHQNGMSVKLSSGDDYDFASVDSHRLRLGFRYSQKDQQQGEFYTGLAWEYEFDGEARASIGGDAAPSPSLKGSSTMLELGYRFMPENSRVSYDLHLNGWQGKRKGISGGVAVKWAF